MLTLLLAVIVIGIASSTRDQRRAARQRVARWNPLLWGATAAIIAVLAIPWR